LLEAAGLGRWKGIVKLREVARGRDFQTLSGREGTVTRVAFTSVARQ
jgi:hypothetical protein